MNLRSTPLSLKKIRGYISVPPMGFTPVRASKEVHFSDDFILPPQVIVNLHGRRPPSSAETLRWAHVSDLNEG